MKHAFLKTESMCSFQSSLVSNVIPRYLAEFCESRFVPWMLYVNEMGSRLYVNLMTVHFPDSRGEIPFCCEIPSVAGYQGLFGGSVSRRCL